MAAPILPESPVERVIAKLTRVKAAGRGQWMARCPSHDDHTASLSIKEGADGRVLMKCHASCENTSIVSAIGLTMSDLFAPGTRLSAATTSPAPAVTRSTVMVKSYDYTDADGALLFQVCRFKEEGGKKTFRQRKPNGTGGWDYKLGELVPVLYNLPGILAAVESGRTVFVVEGEKDADALIACGLPATTSPMGAGKWRESYTASLAGAEEVVILPDNDEPGAAHAEQIAASITAANGTAKIVKLAGLPPKGDVSNWLDAGHDIDELFALVEKAPRWTADAMEAAHRTRWRLDELLGNEVIMRPPPIVVPRFAWQARSTLLAAREKAGKSTLTGKLTAAVSNGERFLDGVCQQGDVLVIGIEEFLGDTARRLRDFKANPKHVYLVDRFVGEPAMRADEFRDHVESIAPLLVIIDTFAAYGRGLIADENNASQVQEVVQPLTDVVHQLGCALILVHHTTKVTGKARGSTSITGGVDVVCEFDIPREDTDPTLRRVRSVGRVPVPRLYEIRFDGNDYTLADGVEAPLDERIMVAVQNAPGISADGVAEAVNARRSEVLTRLTHMLADGRLRNDGKNSRYRLVVPGNPMNPMGM